MATSKKLRVLVTVFACSPDHGSEPGIGWGWVVSLSKVCQLTVLTTSCNRRGIEKAVENGILIDADFIYVDVLPGVARFNEKGKGKIGVLVRLVLWQCRVKKYLKKWVKAHEVDILHHITLGSFRMPFSVTGHGVASVVGPVGGCEDFPEHLLPEASIKIRTKERIRNWMNRLHTRYGIAMSRFSSADLTLSCTQEMCDGFNNVGIKSIVFPNIGVPSEEPLDPPNMVHSGQSLSLLFVGNLVYWKGLELCLLALQKLPENVTLTLIGSGGERAVFESDVRRLGLENRVFLVGALPRHELLLRYKSHDVFFFPSLHDSGGMCVIEAMRACLPVVCLNAGGPGVSVTSECGYAVELGPKRDVVKGLCAAVTNYLKNPELVRVHGVAAARRVNSAYHWDKNAGKMIGLYHELLRSD